MSNNHDDFWRGAPLPQHLQPQAITTLDEYVKSMDRVVFRQYVVKKAVEQMGAVFDTPRPLLWWEVEREQQRAAKERAIALRNDVRRICGQGDK